MRFQRFTMADGLSQNTVYAMAQDHQGFLWLGTYEGLNRYDGYSFTHYKSDPENPHALSNNFVQALCLDSQGRLWVGTAGGLDLYDARRDCFVHYGEGAPASGLLGTGTQSLFVDRRGGLWVGTKGGLNRYVPGRDVFQPVKLDKTGIDTVMAIGEDSDEDLWLATQDGLVRYGPKTGRVQRYRSDTSGLPDNLVTAVLPDGRGGMWAATRGGLARYNADTDTVVAYPADPGRADTPAENDINVLGRDGEGRLWLGTRHSGLDRFDEKTGGFVHHRSDPLDPESLSHNGVLSLLHDRNGIFWVGTDVGLNKYIPATRKFGLVRRLAAGTPLPGYNDIRAVTASSSGDVWLGTYGQGLTHRAAGSGAVTHYRHDPDRADSLSGNLVWMVRYDKAGNLWVGTDTGLSRLPPGADRFVNYPTRDTDPRGLSQACVYAFFEDGAGRRWFGTSGGLNQYLGEEAGFRALSTDVEHPDNLSSPNIWSFAQADDDKLWVGTGDGGLNLFDPATDTARRYVYEPGRVGGLPNNSVYCLTMDQRRTFLYIGTHGGLARMSTATIGDFETFTDKDGLPSNTICGVLEDVTGNLWVSTKRGLVVLSPEGRISKTYRFEDGLQNDEFNENAIYKDARGMLYFAGVGGYNAFYPGEIEPDGLPPRVVVTELLLFNKPVKLQSEDPTSPLPVPISRMQRLALSYKHRMVTFQLAALHLAHPMENRFAYQLEGHDEEWIHSDAAHRFATYTSLPPGSYTFRAKAANRDGRWGEVLTLNVHVDPPPWSTWWAYLGYAVAGICLFVWYLRLVRGRLEKERQIAEHIRLAAEKDQAIAEQERKTAHRLREVDRMKDEFLANTSHELRTPLNGIIGLAETLLDGSLFALPDDARTNLELIVSSARRLSTLVNDILDFSRLKNSTLTLNCKPVDAHALAQVVVSLLQPLADHKHLLLENKVPADLPLVHADEVRLQQIFYNLLGNALKFSHAGGVVLSAQPLHGMVRFMVHDTGVGIPAEKLNRIFESFQQADGSTERSFSGSGLGLAITQRLVSLHGGRVDIESRVNQGTTIAVTLPVAVGREVESRAVLRSAERPVAAATPASFAPRGEQGDTDKVGTGLHVLVVDDEPINRRILAGLLLAENFRVSEAEDGQGALDLLAAHDDVDMVLLDIMMPRMSGYEVCRRTRETRSMHELPILFLTAKNQAEDLVAGFECGANDYLVKPVGKAELMSRLRTHLALLHAHRNLEAQVSERTRELREKNEAMVRTQQQMVMQEKMVSLGILTAGISHEINNPTNFVYAGVQNLSADLEKFLKFLVDVSEEEDPVIMADIRRRMTTLKAHAEIIAEGAGRIRGIVRDLHTFSRKDEALEKCVHLTDNLRSTVNLVSAQYHEKVAFVFDCTDPLTMTCRPAELNQVFMNLVVNGCQAIERRLEGAEDGVMGTLTLRTRAEDGMGIIEVADDGIGFDEAVGAHIFEPFFTTKPVGEGSGLGLSISYGIVADHGGCFEVDSRPGEGSCFRIKLPLTRDDARVSAPA